MLSCIHAFVHMHIIYTGRLKTIYIRYKVICIVYTCMHFVQQIHLSVCIDHPSCETFNKFIHRAKRSAAQLTLFVHNAMWNEHDDDDDV
jgi:hypothetical protein